MNALADFNALTQQITNQCSPEHGPRLQRFIELPEIKLRLMTAPGSSRVRNHHAWDGGLLAHLLEMLDIIWQMSPQLPLLRPEGGLTAGDQIVTCVVLHDLNKLGGVDGSPYYVPNILKSGKRSDAEPYCTSDGWIKAATAVPPSPTPVGIQIRTLLELAHDNIADGDISLALVAALDPELYAVLPPGVRFAIRHHDGMYGKNRRELSGGGETALQLLLHFADMWSSRQARWVAAP